MIFITVEKVDELLSVDWAEQDQKAKAVMQANAWLNTKKFCSGLKPAIDRNLEMAAALLAQEASSGKLYADRDGGLVSESTVKADTLQVTEKFVSGSEQSKSGDMQFIDDLISPFLCSGGSINTWVCK